MSRIVAVIVAVLASGGALFALAPSGGARTTRSTTIEQPPVAVAPVIRARALAGEVPGAVIDIATTELNDAGHHADEPGEWSRVRIRVLDASGRRLAVVRLVGKTPGGGCIHILVPLAAPGTQLRFAGLLDGIGERRPRVVRLATVVE